MTLLALRRGCSNVQTTGKYVCPVKVMGSSNLAVCYHQQVLAASPWISVFCWIRTMPRQLPCLPQLGSLIACLGRADLTTTTMYHRLSLLTPSTTTLYLTLLVLCQPCEWGAVTGRM